MSFTPKLADVPALTHAMNRARNYEDRMWFSFLIKVAQRNAV